MVPNLRCGAAERGYGMPDVWVDMV